MIYYFPSKIDHKNLNKASKIRPFEISRNLKSDDILIQGDSFSRVFKLINCLFKYRGDKIIYIESNNMPFYLSELRKLKLWFILEILLLFIFKYKSFKIGVFYRDLFWRHSDFKPKSIKNYIKQFFFIIEWKFYNIISKVFFLPNKKIVKILPENNKKIVVLWPGLNVHSRKIKISANNNFNFIYIGGVLPPFYDISPLFKIAKQIKKHNFIICTRKEEWDIAIKNKIYVELKNIKVVFKSYNEINKLYEYPNTILIDPRIPFGYSKFALPFKYLESSSYGCPILNFKGSAADDFFNKNKYSWSFNSEGEIIKFIKNLKYYTLENKSKKILKSINKHKWSNRISFLKNTLLNC